MEETFPKDDFGVIVENSNGKEIIDYLVSKGFDKYCLTGTAADNTFYEVYKGDKYISCKNRKGYFLNYYTLEQLKQLDMNQIDYTIKGTKLPEIPEGTGYRVFDWADSTKNCYTSTIKTNFVSFGSKNFNGETYILAEKKHYTWKSYYMFKLSDIQKLTNQNTEKEIIGYELVKPEYAEAVLKIEGHKCIGTGIKTFQILKSRHIESVSRLKKAGVLDLWFEPVYKEEFKVGDWVVFRSTVEIAKITKVDYSSNIYWWGNGHSSGKEHLRLATKEEIEKASEQIISMNGKFNLTIKDKKVFHKSEDITEYVKTIRKYYTPNVMTCVYGNYDFHIKDMILSKTGCESQETYLSDWLKVYELIK